MGATAGFAQKTAAVALVNHYNGIVCIGQIANFVELRNGAVHAKTAIGNDDSAAQVLTFNEFVLQIGHIVVLVAVALCLTKPHAINDAGMV